MSSKLSATIQSIQTLPESLAIWTALIDRACASITPKRIPLLRLYSLSSPLEYLKNQFNDSYDSLYRIGQYLMKICT